MGQVPKDISGLRMFNVYRQGRWAGSAFAESAIEAIDMWIYSRETDEERVVLPGPYMAIDEKEDTHD